MKTQRKLLAMVLCLLALGTSGCTTASTETIDSIPTGAQKLTTVELIGQGGSFTAGSFSGWNDGRMILDVNLESGTINTLEIVNAAGNVTVDAVKKPKGGIYDTESYGYRSGNEFKLNIVNSKNLKGSVDVYFIAD